MEDYSHLLLAMYHEARLGAPGEFFTFLMRQLQRVFQFDSAVMATGLLDPNGLRVRTCQLWNQPIGIITDYASIAADDPARLAMLRSPGRVISASYHEQTARHRCSKQWQTYLHRWNIGQTLCLLAPYAGTPLSTVTALWRPLDGPGFTQRDRQLGQLLLPHVVQALAFNLADSVSAVNLEYKASTVIVDPTGFMIAMDERAQALLQSEWPRWQPPVLPPALSSIARTDTVSCFSGRQIEVRAQPHVNCRLLHIRHKSVAVLTDAEQRVALHATQGRSYKEIARELSISPATVRNHLHNIYEKLAVTSKTGLAAKLAAY